VVFGRRKRVLKLFRLFLKRDWRCHVNYSRSLGLGKRNVSGHLVISAVGKIKLRFCRLSSIRVFIEYCPGSSRGTNINKFLLLSHEIALIESP
jgi:hypothetical protein